MLCSLRFDLLYNLYSASRRNWDNAVGGSKSIHVQYASPISKDQMK